ncbi:AAA family ATPase [Micromonospora sp. MS34]|uniref:helix-turn-helix transcriptional regulator n=1 Tax=Micromonospora sp. MS34 TaxID=3385971 RepID=UPI0039A1DE2F
MDRRRLRGRESEMGVLRRLLDDVAESGSAAAALVHGEPGIGKTALLDATIQYAAECGFRVAYGRAEENDQVAPLASLLEALRHGPAPLLTGADLAALPLHQEQRYWLVEQVAGLIESQASRTPIMIAVDDLHWADPLSRFALRVLPVRLRGSPVCWALTSREETEAVALRVERVRLRPLPPAAVEALAADILRAPVDDRLRALLTGAGGNPFLAVEMMEGLAGAPTADGPPDRLVTGVRGRLGSLPPQTLRFLQAGAVLGRRFTLSDAQVLLGAPAATLIADTEAAVYGSVLADDGERLEFRHDLLRQAVYAGIPPSARNVLHRAAASHLLRGGRRPTEAVRHLLIGVGPGDEDALGLLRDAADDVTTALPALAADLLLRALSLTPPGHPDYFPTAERAIRLLTLSQRNREAVDVADAALDQRPGDETAGRIEAALGRALWNLWWAAELSRRTERALGRSGLTPRTRARLESLRALALSRSRDQAAARDAGKAALAAAEALGDEQALTTALLALGETAFNEGYCREALHHFERLRDYDPTAILWEILVHQHLDNFDTSARLIAEARRECEREGSRLPLAAVLWAQASQTWLLGQLDDLDADLRTISELDGDGPPAHAYTMLCQITLIRLAMLRGDDQGARQLLSAAKARLGAAADPGDVVHVRLGEAWLLAATGDAPQAVEIMCRDQQRDDHWLVQTRTLRPLVGSFIDIALRGGSPALAGELAAQADLYASRNPGAVTAAGMAAHANGLVTADLSLLERAVHILADSPRRLVYARAAADYGQALLRAGHRQAGIRQLLAAAQTFARTGSPREAEQLDRILRSLGALRRARTAVERRPATGWAALTPTERRIARLVAEGHTNRSAATQLSISPHTVNTHLGSVFRKLQVTTRVQLTRAVLIHDPAT